MEKQIQTSTNSELFGFYRLPMAQRWQRLAQITDLQDDDRQVISGEQGLQAEQADQMVENALGVMGMPLGLCVNLRVDGRDRLVPMAIEEPSVIAAASHASKLLRAGGGVQTRVSPAHMIGQVQVVDPPDLDAAAAAVRGAKDRLLRLANDCDPGLVAVGGGAVDLELRPLPPLDSGDVEGPMLVLHLVVDVRDAMGANSVNTMCERLAPVVQELTGGRVRLRIVSNLADRRTVVARGQVPLNLLKGKDGLSDPLDVARGIQQASVFAERDPYRAATHNKGIMNGVDAVLLAFGQDWRAVEAGAHAFAAREGRYTALARWRVEGYSLRGRLELPLAVGVVGGVTWTHPTVQVTRRVAGIDSAADLASLAAAVGLAQNLGALRALASEGIQRGHMRVHARNFATAAGASGPEVDQVARQISARGQVSLGAASQSLGELRRDQAQRLSAAGIRARFEDLRQAHMPRILELLDQVAAEDGGDSLAAMCAYQMRTGGKRLRALLPLLVAEVLGHDPGRLVPFGAACEMLHNATLVHDDVQDGDRVRRGQATVWDLFGVPRAINLGDAMYYYTLLLVERLDLPAARRQALARRVLRETLRVIGGQELELELMQARAPDLAQYEAMVEGKTSGLFALPMAGAAELCGAAPELARGLGQAAGHLGVLFQIQDDVLDLYGDKGRDQRGGDIREGKRSILAVHALQHLPPPEAVQLRQILDLDRQQTDAGQVQRALDLLHQAGSLGFALEQIASRREQALAVPELTRAPALRRLVAAICELFLQPIQPVLERHGRPATWSQAV